MTVRELLVPFHLLSLERNEYYIPSNMFMVYKDICLIVSYLSSHQVVVYLEVGHQIKVDL